MSYLNGFLISEMLLLLLGAAGEWSSTVGAYAALRKLLTSLLLDFFISFYGLAIWAFLGTLAEWWI